MDDVCIRVVEAARLAGVSEATIRQAIHEGQLHAVKGSRTSPWRIRLDHLKAWAADIKAQGANTAECALPGDNSLTPDESLVLDESSAVAPRRRP